MTGSPQAGHGDLHNSIRANIAPVLWQDGILAERRYSPVGDAIWDGLPRVKQRHPLGLISKVVEELHSWREFAQSYLLAG